MEALLTLTRRMAEEGIRRLLVLSGEPQWCEAQALALRRLLAGDGLWVGPRPMPAPYCPPAALLTLLGNEYRHAFFDARSGFDVAAFAALAGTLRAGSWLVLLTPPFTDWPTRPDDDAVRWSDTPRPIAAPVFIRHFCRIVAEDPQTLIWRQHHPFAPADFPPRPRWTPADGEPAREQAALLTALLAQEPGVSAVTAGRGRGKSALAGMLIRRLPGSAIVTAPTRDAAATLAEFAGERFRFLAPDALLAGDERADWLIVDEAAAIPAPLLRRLTARFPHTLLTTTVQGYEGTGRGFLLKFCASFPQLRRYSLSQPIRWAAGCPLEAAIDEALLFDDQSIGRAPGGEARLERVEQAAWRRDPGLLRAMYLLLSGAHYRTSPLDLRRMMDAPGQHFICARAADGLAGALWLVEEGGLSAELSRAVWAGFRRPRGNLVAQSLAAHGGSPLAATLRGLRISRIAVHPARQRAGIGLALAECAVAAAAGCDYLSVSFGYTPELWRFWRRCGFMLARLGSRREASSGCYTAMALRPLSAAGRRLAEAEQRRLRRDEYWLGRWRDEPSPLAAEPPGALRDDDWLELAGFAFAHRPLTAAAGALYRLLARATAPLPALRGRLQPRNESELCAALKLSGRKALLARLREEASQALYALDGERAAALRRQVEGLRYSGEA